MAYVPDLDWVDDEPPGFDTERMNKMQLGIADASSKADEASTAINGRLSDGALTARFPQAQTDYVELLAERAPTGALQVRRMPGGGGFMVSCVTGEGPAAQHVTYEVPTPHDDYWVVGRVTTGAMLLADYAGYPWPLQTSGTFEPATTVYTTDVGALFTVPITVPYGGGDVILQHYADNRGGLWQFTLDGNTETEVSTYSATSGTTESVIYSDISEGEYTLVGTFLGEDPTNPVSTPRGWLTSVDGSRPVIKISANTPGPSPDRVIAPKSNRDFALKVALPGGDPQFVPYHGADTAVAVESLQVYDGATLIDPTTLAAGEVIEAATVELVQHIYGRNPGSGTQALIEVWTSQRIYPNGRLSINGRWRALGDVVLDRGYVIMCPVRGDGFDMMVTSLRNQYPQSAALYGTSTYLTAETDQASSYMFLSESMPDVAVAFRYNNAAETVRRGMTNKRPANRRVFLEHRNADYLKLYQCIYADGATIPAGTVHRFSGDYLHAVAPTLLDLFRLD